MDVRTSFAALLGYVISLLCTKGDYELRFYTGNLTGSDTSAQVYYALEGTDGNVTRVNVTGGNFSLDAVTTVTHYGDYGPFGVVTIGHDNSGPSPEWYLRYFEIADLTRLITYMFECECWFRGTILERSPTWPIAGVWAEWSEWTYCDYETLLRSRDRECVVEYPQYGGSCPGDATEVPDCNPVEWYQPYDFTENVVDTDLAVCLPLLEPTRDNLVHVANITKETNISSDVIVTLTTTMSHPQETCQETGLLLTYQLKSPCSSESATLTTCDLLGNGTVETGLLLCSHACPCNGQHCEYGLYYQQYKHYLSGYGINENVRELCKVDIVQ